MTEIPMVETIVKWNRDARVTQMGGLLCRAFKLPLTCANPTCDRFAASRRFRNAAIKLKLHYSTDSMGNRYVL